MSYTLPSGTTAVPGQKILSARYNAALNSIAAALNARRESTELTPKTVGGFGEDVSALTGLAHFYNGTVEWESGTVFVDSLGADPTGAADSSAAVQDAIDGNYRRVLFNPSGIYKFNTAVTVPSLPNANTLSTGREIDGQGCRIVGANGIANCFVFTDAVAPNTHRHGKFHDFVFDGTVTGAFVLQTGGRSWFNSFYRLRVALPASGLALLQFYNTAAVSPSQPGWCYIHDLYSSLRATLKFSMEGGAAPQFDDFWISHIIGGDPSFNAASGAIVIESGCVLTDSLVQNVFSGGRNGIYAVGGYLQKCVIQRVLVEIPPKADYPGSNTTTNYGIAGDIKDCEIGTVHMNFPNVTDNPGVRCVYAILNDVYLLNLKMNATGTGTVPYAGTNILPYPALEAAPPSNNITFDFPQEYIYTGVNLSAATHVSYLGGRLETLQNTTGLAPTWVFKGGTINNYGQGAVDCTSTLPAATEGLSVTYNMIGDGGGDYHIKPATGEQIFLNGTVLAVGNKITCGSPTFGNRVRLVTTRTGSNGDVWLYTWIASTEGGTWIDGGA